MADGPIADDVAAIVLLARRASGVAFDAYRRTTLERRVTMRMAQLRCPDLASYRTRVEEDPAEAKHLADLLLVRTTEAFRDPAVFDVLRGRLLPALAVRRAREGERRLRVWSAGVSTGEEAFSLGALALLAAEPHGLEVEILASDVSAVALERAARGLVPAGRMAGVPLDIRRRFFQETREGAVVVPELLRRITFARHDLLDTSRIAPEEAVVASFDVVSCRNVLIYLELEVGQRLVERLLNGCSPGGLLLLGSAESLPRRLSALASAAAPGLSIYERAGDGRG